MSKSNILEEIVRKICRGDSQTSYTKAGLGLAALMAFSVPSIAQAEGGCSTPRFIDEDGGFQFCDDNVPVCDCIADIGYGGEIFAGRTEVLSSSYDSINIIEEISDIGYGGIVSCQFTATDNRPNEDTNGNGVLDSGEDLNGNGVLDEDTGIFGVELAPGATNMAISQLFCFDGSPECFFRLEQIDPNLPAVAEVNAFDGFANACKPAFQLGAFDPFGGLRVTPSRNLRLFLNRPIGSDEDIGAARCIETTTQANPLPLDLAFRSFGTGNSIEFDIQIESPGNGTKAVCCEFQDVTGGISPPACGFITLDESAPPAPENISARAKTGKVDVTWDLVLNADKYNVFRSSSSGGPYTKIGESPNGVFADFNATAGATFFYVVQSVSGTLLSGQSNEVGVTVPTGRLRRTR